MDGLQSRITIKDLAKILEVAPSTISRALKDHPGISSKTRKRIQREAVKRGYYPNSVASNLRKRKTNLIGVIVPRIDRAFHSYAISGIEKVASQEGYYVVILQSNNSYQREKDNARMLLEYQVDGIIACMAQETNNYDHFELIKKNNIPLVFFDRVCPEMETHRVVIDDYAAISKATQHLLSLGCKRIAHIGGNQNIKIFSDRFEGYKNTLLENNLEYDSDMVVFTQDLNIDEGYEAVKKFIEFFKKIPDGIVCSNDQSAVGAIHAIKKAGLRIPEDVAVTGFSNTSASIIVEPNLTTIDDHALEMGEASAQLIIRQISGNLSKIASEVIFIQNDLVVRDSTMKL